MNRLYQKPDNLLNCLSVNKIDIYDVAIIGGGPAGSTAAKLRTKTIEGATIVNVTFPAVI